MDQNRDWKLTAALVLAGLALFVALGGARGHGNDQVSMIPQQIIVQSVAPSTGTTGGTTAPLVTVPGTQTDAAHTWGGWRGGWPIFPFFPLLFLAGFVFLAFRLMGHRRYGWGGHGHGGGWYGRPYGGPGPGPQAQPYEQYPQGQGQPYGGYPQGQQHQQGQPTQATDSTDAHGDITRPQGSGH